MTETKQKRRRFRSPHPGVKVKKRTWPSGTIAYFGVYVDPDSLREVSESLTKKKLTNEETRKDWAIKKSREIQRRKEELEVGAPRRTETPIETAVQRFFSDKQEELSPTTISVYQACLGRFSDWAIRAKLKFAEHLAQPHLAALRSYLVTLPRRSAVAGGKRGQRADGLTKRSPQSINQDLRSIKTMLNEWRRWGLTPLLNSDYVADTLRFVRTPQNLKSFLDQDEIAAVLAACIKHDGKTFDETRKEHAGLVPKGTTRRYCEITPFFIAMLLTGSRLSEMRTLRWDQVKLDQDYLALADATGVKTRRGRRIPLDVTPLLALLLANMKQEANGATYVFGGEAELSEDLTTSSRKRVIRSCDAPPFDWPKLRRTCGTFLTCSDGIYKGSSAWMSAARLGHDVRVAERHYIGALSNIPKNVKTLEQAMGIEEEIKTYLEKRFNIVLEKDKETGKWRTYRYR